MLKSESKEEHESEATLESHPPLFDGGGGRAAHRFLCGIPRTWSWITGDCIPEVLTTAGWAPCSGTPGPPQLQFLRPHRLGIPPPRRCGWRAPRLTLQLGRRLAIGLKIAAPARSPARPGKGRISPAGAEPQAELISSPHGSSSRVPLFRCAALLLRPAARRGHAAPGRPVQRAERRQEDGCRGPGRAAGAAHAHDPRAQVGRPCLQERVRLLLRLPGKEDPWRGRAAGGLGNG